MSGAVDLGECQFRRYYRANYGCRCGKCAVCGYPKHSGIHGPVFGQPPGSEPWGHEYVPRATASVLVRCSDNAISK